MKKIIFILLSLMMFVSVVKAEDYSPWQEEEIIDESFDIESEIRYRFYRDEIEGEYLINNSNYKYVDYDNYYFDTYDDYNNTCPSESIVNKFNVYPYMEVEKTGYILINNNDKELLIDMLKVYYDGEEIKYNITDCSKCDLMFFTMAANGSMTLNLNKKLYDTSKLKIYLATNNMELANYQISLYNDNLLTKKTGSIYTESNVNEHIVNASWLTNVTYSELKYSLNVVEKTPFNIPYMAQTINKCSIKYTYYYNIYREYYDDNYYVELEDEFLNEIYIKDLDDYKIYYRYKIKDISRDNVTNDLVEENTINEIDYISDYIYLEDNDYLDFDEDRNINNYYDDNKDKSGEMVIDKIIDVDNNTIEDNSKRQVDLVNTLDIKKYNYSKIYGILLIILLLFVGILAIIKKKMSKEKND